MDMTPSPHFYLKTLAPAHEPGARRATRLKQPKSDFLDRAHRRLTGLRESGDLGFDRVPSFWS